MWQMTLWSRIRKSAECILMFALTLSATSVHAQSFLDSPPPLMGQQAYHLYSIPGVIWQGGLETFISCLNTTSGTIRVGVEVFGYSGGAALNDPSATSLDLGPAASATFGTGPAVGLTINSDLGAGFGTKGYARVLATKKGIICTAFVADAANFPLATSWQLNIVAKTKQRGD